MSVFQLFPKAGLSPLQFVTRERITRAQQMMRAVTDARQRPGFQTKRSLIENGAARGSRDMDGEQPGG